MMDRRSGECPRGRRALAVLAATLLSGISPLMAADAPEAPGRAEYFHALAPDVEGRALFLGTHFGLYRSDDGRQRWTRVALSARPPHPDVLAIAPDPKESRVLYAGAHDRGVLKSADHGRTWREVNTGLGGLDVHGLAADPTDSASLYAAVIGVGEGVYRTTDRGTTWSRIGAAPPGELRALGAAASPDGTGGASLWAGTSEGLRRVQASGEWKMVTRLPMGRTAKAVVVNPREASVIHVVLGDELLKSADAGRRWSAIGPVITNLAALAVNPKRPAEMYVVSDDGAFFKTTDGGTTWEQLTERTGRDEMKR